MLTTIISSSDNKIMEKISLEILQFAYGLKEIFVYNFIIILYQMAFFCVFYFSQSLDSSFSLRNNV